MTIILGTDFSSQAELAFRVATELALEGDEPLIIAHAVTPPVVPDGGFYVPQLIDALEKTALDQLGVLVDDAQAHGLHASAELIPVPIHESLIELAATHRARLIVVGTHGRGAAGRLLLGSLAERLLQDSEVPVLVVGRDGAELAAAIKRSGPLRVALAVEPSDATDSALAYLRQWSRFRPLDVSCIHVCRPTHSNDSRRETDAMQRTIGPRVAQFLGPRTTLSVSAVRSRTAAEIREQAFASHAELLVMGSHQRKGLDSITHPSVAISALHEDPASLLCVPRLLTEAVLERAARSA